MIDYEKLKLAHELAHKTTDYFVAFYFGNTIEKKDEFTLFDSNGVIDRNFSSIDDLIAKLKQLTQPNPKYEVGQEVWFAEYADDIENAKIVEIMRTEVKVKWNLWLPEKKVYPSREALIEAQIEYWNSLKNEEKSTRLDDMSMSPPFDGEIKGFNQCAHNYEMPCEHQSDGILYNEHSIWIKFLGADGDKRYIDGNGYKEGWLKCRKCGELYK